MRRALRTMTEEKSDTALLKKNIENFEKKQPCFDEILEEIGGFGRFQLFALIVLNSAMIPGAGDLIGTSFIAMNRCGALNMTNVTLVPELPQDEFFTLHDQLQIPCSDRPYYKALMTSSVMITACVSSLVAGQLADWYGRKIIAMISLFCLTGSNLLVAYGATMIPSLFGLMLNGLFVGPLFTSISAYLIEFTPIRYRLTTVCCGMFPIGMIALAAAGYATKTYSGLAIIFSVLHLPTLIGICFLPESPRWLIQHRRFSAANAVLARIARWNGAEPPRRLDAEEYVVNAQNRVTYLDLFKRRTIALRVLALMFVFFAAASVSNSMYFFVGNLFGSPYLNQTILGSLKIVLGFTPLLAERFWGRRLTVVTAIVTASVCSWCVVFLYVSTGVARSTAITVFTLATAALIDPVWRISITMSAEVFPTVARVSARSMCQLGARLGSTVAPQILLLNQVHIVLPYCVFGVITVFQLISIWFGLPETRGQKLADNFGEFDEGEKEKQ